MTLSPENLAAVAGIALSLIFSYAPGLSAKFSALDPTRKRLIFAFVLLATAIGFVAYECRVDTACYSANVEQAVTVFVAALVASQGVYLLTPKK